MNRKSDAHGVTDEAQTTKRKRLLDWHLAAAKGGTIRLLTLPVSATCAIITARLTIEATGIQAYGYVNAIATLFLLIPFADLGIGTAVTNSVASQSVSNNYKREIELTLISAVRKLILVAVLLMVTLAIAAAVEGLGPILGVPYDLLADGQWILALPFVVYFTSLPLSLGYRMLIGMGRSDVLAGIGLIAPITTLLYTILLTRLPAGPLWFSSGPPIGLLVTNAVAIWISTRRLNVSLSSISRDSIKIKRVSSVKVMNVAWPMLIVSSTFAVLLHSHKLLLAHSSDSNDLAAYALAIQLFLPAWSVVHMSGTILWSEFARSDKKMGLWKQANILMTGVSAGGGTALVLIGPYVIGVMEPSNSLHTTPILVAFAALMLVLGMDLTQTMLLVSAADLKFRAIWALIATAVYTICAVRVVATLGATGLILCTAAIILFVQGLPNALRSWHKLKRLETI